MVDWNQSSAESGRDDESVPDGPILHVLGTAQDAGIPHAGCRRECCQSAWLDPSLRRRAACVAIVDPSRGQRWLFEATPDFREQLHTLDGILTQRSPLFSGIFLTHAHLGHYTGLLQLGRESLGARNVPVYAMPNLRLFLESNGPWNLLVELENISLQTLAAEVPVSITPECEVIPWLVPHRGEFSETVAFHIQGPNRRVLFLPDIDRWEQWDRDLAEVVESVDVAYLDGCFFSSAELPERSLTEIPHPPIEDTMRRLRSLPLEAKGKVRFLHFNHSNPAARSDSPEARRVLDEGFGLAREGECLVL